jgi:hypothetical protein
MKKLLLLLAFAASISACDSMGDDQAFPVPCEADRISDFAPRILSIDFSAGTYSVHVSETQAPPYTFWISFKGSGFSHEYQPSKLTYLFSPDPQFIPPPYVFVIMQNGPGLTEGEQSNCVAHEVVG